MKMCYCSVFRKLEVRREGRKGSVDDVKEEFLFKLGFERIEV